jgi:hypothetical protein
MGCGITFLAAREDYVYAAPVIVDLVHEHPKELFRKLEAAGVNAISANQT